MQSGPILTCRITQKGVELKGKAPPPPLENL